MPHESVDTRILLIRHPDVAAAYHGVCYGRSDVELSAEGQQSCRVIAESVAKWRVSHVVHSGLQRTRQLAECIGRRIGVRPTCEVELRERDFGSWEMQTWDDIYRDCGDNMSKMTSDPDGFRPGGRETTSEFAERVWQWSQAWSGAGITVAVAHGGTIAALLGRQRSLPVSQWPSLIPAYGEMVWHIPHSLRSRV